MWGMLICYPPTKIKISLALYEIKSCYWVISILRFGRSKLNIQSAFDRRRILLGRKKYLKTVKDHWNECGNLSNQGQSAEWLVELCSAGLTAVVWVERGGQGIYQLVAVEENRGCNYCRLQTAVMPDVNKTKPVFSVGLEKKQPVQTTWQKSKRSHRGTNCQILYTLNQNRTDWCKKHVELLGKTERYLTLWNYKGMCLMTVDTSSWLIYCHEKYIFQVKKCQFYDEFNFNNFQSSDHTIMTYKSLRLQFQLKMCRW